MAKKNIEFKNLDKTTTSVYAYPKRLNKEIRSTLNNQGFPIVKNNVIKYIPISSKNHAHARTSNSVRRMALKDRREYQMGFYLTFYKRFWYLKFPNEGTGQSRKNKPEKFIERGRRDSLPSIQRLVNQTVKNAKVF